ncbi:nucleoside deaminase [Streptomyces sp. NBC_01724]|uniref:nucleoside deaminase n=1 Tax=unclassified Streptomyces TaxID=2593676 RepID=UPI002E37B044|nr:nucleoside deaminase [Streptomyces sp. NBC_01724]WTE49419.1 nucleoside deaminase [Streptomyces sp. NBC_01620]
MTTPDDHALLRLAIALAAQARAAGNPPFGSLLSGPDGTVLAEERNTTLTDQDITAHPELKLARWAARELDTATAAETTMYTSCQPCEMCEAVIRQAGLRRVVFALSNEQLLDIRPGSGRPPVPQDGPALLDEVRAVVEGFTTAEPAPHFGGHGHV